MKRYMTVFVVLVALCMMFQVGNAVAEGDNPFKILLNQDGTYRVSIGLMEKIFPDHWDVLVGVDLTFYGPVLDYNSDWTINTEDGCIYTSSCRSANRELWTFKILGLLADGTVIYPYIKGNPAIDQDFVAFTAVGSYTRLVAEYRGGKLIPYDSPDRIIRYQPPISESNSSIQLKGCFLRNTVYVDGISRQDITCMYLMGSWTDWNCETGRFQVSSPVSSDAWHEVGKRFVDGIYILTCGVTLNNGQSKYPPSWEFADQGSPFFIEAYNTKAQAWWAMICFVVENGRPRTAFLSEVVGIKMALGNEYSDVRLCGDGIDYEFVPDINTPYIVPEFNRVYDPHVISIGESAEWPTTCNVMNIGLDVEHLTVFLYNSAGLAKVFKYTIPPLGHLTFLYSDLMEDAVIGEIKYTKNLVFPKTYLFEPLGLVALLNLSGDASEHIVIPLVNFEGVVGRGIAISNTTDTDTSVQLYAIKDGEKVGPTEVYISAHDKIVGTVDSWFEKEVADGLNAVYATAGEKIIGLGMIMSDKQLICTNSIPADDLESLDEWSQ